MEKSNKDYLEKLQKAVEKRLLELIPLNDGNKLQQTVLKAMKYSLEAGGKRIRPVLVMEFCRLCGGNVENAVDTACALEMLHTFSLIHDDLPCMDDDDLRRGRPSCHIAYGEAAAMLAGDALSILPFQIIAEDGKLSPEVKVALITELSSAAGAYGMIGGQMIDLEQGEDVHSKDVLLEMYRMKTGALLKCACKMGALIGNASEKQLQATSEYAEKLGLAFQIVDDILDVTGDEKVLGKHIGSDREQEKGTYVALFGLDNARETAKRLTEEALNALNSFCGGEFLTELTESLLIRKY